MIRFKEIILISSFFYFLNYIKSYFYHFLKIKLLNSVDYLIWLHSIFKGFALFSSLIG